MLDLAGERTAGTHPYFTPVAHTRLARERLGPGALVAPEVACVVDDDGDRAAAAARRYAAVYLGLANYTRNLLRFGYSDGDLAGDGSARLLGELVPIGAARAAEVVRAHLDAGADHVCVQAVGAGGLPEREWAALAAELLA
jgi:probable F420-dependent oxidoreductase